MIQLRDYQTRGVMDIRQSYLNGFRAPLFVLPTGGGKTILFTYIAQNTAIKQKKVLILVHRVELLRQSSAALREFGVRHGLINPKYTPDYSAHVQVASVQTMKNRLGKMPFSPDLIIIDEAHHATATQWREIVGFFNKSRLLGVTATPVRGDGAGLGVQSGGIFDTMLLGPTTRELMDMGYLVEPIVYAPKNRLDLSEIKIKMGDYDKKQLAKAMDKPTITGDAVEHYKRLCPGTPAVAFCVSVEHAEHVATEFREAGFRAFSVDGSMDDDKRTRILKGLGNGAVDVVTSCDLISEGTDIPAIGCGILLRPTQSEGLYLQQVGRVLRPCEGKQRAILLDHVGNVLTHGLPDANREWSLEGEKKKNKKQDKLVRAVQCKSCYAIHAPTARCPVCGHIEPKAKQSSLKYKEGELKQITSLDAEVIKSKKIANMEIGKAQSLEELIEIARLRGYKSGWATHVWQAKQKKITKENQQ